MASINVLDLMSEENAGYALLLLERAKQEGDVEAAWKLVDILWDEDTIWHILKGYGYK